jgi:hypothetical protein
VFAFPSHIESLSNPNERRKKREREYKKMCYTMSAAITKGFVSLSNKKEGKENSFSEESRKSDGN